MNGLIKLGLLLGVIGAVAAGAALSAWPPTRGLAPLVVLPLAVQGVGYELLRRERQPLGAIIFGVGSLLLTPMGLVGAVGAWRGYAQHRFGTTLGKKPPEARPRPRPWTMAAIVYGASAAGALGLAVAWPHVAHLGEVETALIGLSAALLGILSGVEAVLLWLRHPQAVRLGTTLSLVGLLLCVIAGFQMHSYLAVALLPVPLYGLMLVLSGRERWKGLEPASDGPGIEGRARRRAAAQ